MMTVSGFDTLEQAERRATYYRSLGYRVEICSIPGTMLAPFLRCTPVKL